MYFYCFLECGDIKLDN